MSTTWHSNSNNWPSLTCHHDIWCPRWVVSAAQLSNPISSQHVLYNKWHKHYSYHDQVISELCSRTCHSWSHSVTFHPTQLNTPHLTPVTQAGTWLIYPWGEGGTKRLSWPMRLHTYQDGLPVRMSLLHGPLQYTKNCSCTKPTINVGSSLVQKVLHYTESCC